MVGEYFKYGTVEEVFRIHRYALPVSTATYHRILNQFGVVKATGPNNLLNEAVDFLSHMLHDTASIEEIYKKLPLRFQTSLSTIYRIAEYVKEGITRRVGVGLVITGADSQKLLLAKEDGHITIPMGYAKKRDSRKRNVSRILQHEVFTNLIINQSFPKDLLDQKLEPFMYLDIADVRVAVFRLQLSKGLEKQFGSYKLTNYRFVSVDEIEKLDNLRVGVKEIVIGYKKYLNLTNRNLVVNPIQVQSLLNRELATVAVEISP